MLDAPLCNRIRGELTSRGRRLVDIHGVRRRLFNESLGLATLNRIATRESLNLLNLDSNKYLCVAAANCLIKFLVSTSRLARHTCDQRRTQEQQIELTPPFSSIPFACLILFVVDSQEFRGERKSVQALVLLSPLP